MARQARDLGDSGFLHVMQRGIGQQLLFEVPEDYRYYLRILKKYSGETGVSVCAYCLMENHTHLLLYDTRQKIPELMKKIGVGYSYYFNQKYERVGHLFQDRYRSEVVEDDAGLMMVVRYILNNPREAGICPAKDYPWSSYGDYGDRSAFTYHDTIEGLLGDKASFEKYIAEENGDRCMEYGFKSRHDDRWAMKVIHRQLKGKSGTSLQGLGHDERDAVLKKLKAAGLSVRQLERLTGINRGAIQRA